MEVPVLVWERPERDRSKGPNVRTSSYAPVDLVPTAEYAGSEAKAASVRVAEAVAPQREPAGERRADRRWYVAELWCVRNNGQPLIAS